METSISSPRISDLNPEALMAAASAATGLEDYGDLSFIDGLRVFTDDLRTEARLSERGAMMQFRDIVRMLSNRLGFQRDLIRHPEILNEPMERPIIILGLPRTGSTKLHRMICEDPAVQRLETWRLNFPAPLRDSEGVTPDPRIALAEQIEATLAAEFPELMARHPFEAHEVDEEMWLLELTFDSIMTSIKTRAPNHRAWVQSHSALDAYAYMRHLLQYLQWQGGGAQGRPWILKSPVHVGELRTLLTTFPNAVLVHTHRDPREVIPSFASLMEAAWRTHSDQVDPQELGHDFNTFWAHEMDRHLEDRDDIGHVTILDVYYDDIHARPEAVIEAIYEHAGRTITNEARAAFDTYASRRPRHHFGKYQYTMADYGLRHSDIETAFAGYLERFPRLDG